LPINFFLDFIPQAFVAGPTGPDLSGLCLLFALMQKVTKKSRLQKNG